MKTFADALHGVATTTARAYTQGWNDLLNHLGGIENLSALTSDQVAGWVAAMQARGLAASTICLRLSAVSALFDEADDPTRAIERPIIQHKNTTSHELTAEQVTELLRACDLTTSHGQQDFAIISLLFISGLGLERVRALTWGDLTVSKAGDVTIRATGVKIPQKLFSIITAFSPSRNGWIRNPGAPLFVALEGFAGKPLSSPAAERQPLSPQEINRRINRYARLAGLGCAHLSARSIATTGKALGVEQASALVSGLAVWAPIEINLPKRRISLSLLASKFHS